MKKIQVTIDQPNINGYIYASPENKELLKDFIDLTQFGEECEIDEIYGPEILDALTLDNVIKYIQEWGTLLKVGGKILVGGTDVSLLSKSVILRNTDIKTLNKLLFDKPFFIRSLTSVESIKEIFESIDMYITNISIDYSTSVFTIEARKQHV